jgi:hypothetical protein
MFLGWSCAERDPFSLRDGRRVPSRPASFPSNRDWAKKFAKLIFYHSLRYRATAVISKRVKLFGGVNDKEINSIN